MDWFPILFIIPNASKKLLEFQKMWVTYLRTCRSIILCWNIFITYVITTWNNICMSYLFFNFLKLLLSYFLIIFSYYIISVFNVAQNLLNRHVRTKSQLLSNRFSLHHVHTSTYLLIAANGRANGDWQIEQSARARVMWWYLPVVWILSSLDSI